MPFPTSLYQPTLGVLLLVVLLALRSLYRYFTYPQLPFPPGPRPDPVIGNLRQFPIVYQEKTFAKWADQYGMDHSDHRHCLNHQN